MSEKLLEYLFQIYVNYSFLKTALSANMQIWLKIEEILLKSKVMNIV